MAASNQDLRQRTIRGVLWAGAQMLSTKVGAMVAQVVLARFLLQPREFGLIGLALTVTSLTSLFQQFGLREVLISRHRRFDRWANVAFWMSLPMSLAGAGLTLAIAPLAAAAFGEPALVPYLAAGAAVVFVNGLSIVPAARLQNDLRFRLIGGIGMAEAVGLNAVTIALAWAGMGAYAVVAAQLAAAVTRSAVLWKCAPQPIQWRPQFTRWKYLFGTSAATLGAAVAITMVGQGDYVALGLFHDAATVGTYFFAFNLSIHIHIVLSSALVGVLLTSFSKLRSEPQRQLGAFLSATRLIAAVGMPLCLFQAAFAEQVVHVMFGRGKWEAAIPLLRLLCCGMAFKVATGPAHSMIKAQGRFRQFLACTACYCLGFCLLMLAASRWGGATGVAAVGTLCMICFEPSLIALCVRNAGGAAFREVVNVYRGPALASGFAIGGAVLFTRFARPYLPGELLQIVAALPVAGLLYAAALRVTAPSLFRSLTDRITRRLAKRATSVSVAADEAVTPDLPAPVDLPPARARAA